MVSATAVVRARAVRELGLRRGGESWTIWRGHWLGRIMKFSFFGIVLFVACALVAATASVAPAQEDVSERARWGFYFNLGAGDTRGDFDPAFQKAATGEFGIVRQRGVWRYGLGASFGSFGMEPPYDNELEWGFQRIFVSGTRVFRADQGVRPYLQARLGVARLHPRSLLFEMDPLPDDFEIGDSPTKASNGVHVGVVPGLEWQLSNAVALDFSLMLDYFVVGDTDLSPIGLGSASSGFDWQARLGVLWWTDGGASTESAERDAWGVRPSYGWALGEALAINFGASALNEYVRNANFNQVSPRSWLSNLEEGFTYDDNEFSTNQFIHPFNGSQYYNAARSNGLSFWPSYGIALIGALHWEWMGETHPMSFNDLVSTGIGGAAMGETMYRFSSMMLDNEATGMRRFWREAGSFITDPIRGFNRLVSGRAWKVSDNPTDRMDTNPIGQFNGLSVGWRRIGNGNYPSLSHDVSDHGFVEYLHEHGNVWDNDRRGPWDYFLFDGQINMGDKTKFGQLIMQGNWVSTPIGESDPVKHMGAFIQLFEYINSNAYEYGGQSVGASVYSRWGSSGRLSFDTRFDLLGTIMGAVNSNAASLADVADPERLREYDYGPGAGGRALLELKWLRKPFVTLGYRLNFLYVTNGSVWSGTDQDTGE
ncbi:MAG TPA: DUF3943 domain-containing protein, partial [Candidatus Krumholzibacteria bacterium]|nr:DUF3943 domain-containing protein [Candidatus Krumholzibacteria bacterium]